MIKKSLLFFTCLIIFCLCSCGPIDYFPPEYKLSGVEWNLEPKKNTYSVNEEILLVCVIQADFQKFLLYDCELSAWNSQNLTGERRYLVKIVNEQQDEDMLEKRFSFTELSPEYDGNQIKITLKVIPLIQGEIDLLLSIFPCLRKSSNDLYSFYESKRISVK